MSIKKTKNIKKNISISKSKLLKKEEKKLLKNDKVSLNEGEKYLSPIFSSVSGATYKFENFQ